MQRDFFPGIRLKLFSKVSAVSTVLCPQYMKIILKEHERDFKSAGKFPKTTTFHNRYYLHVKLLRFLGFDLFRTL